MKKKLLALAIGGVLSAGAQAAVTDILITEYVEGGSNNKAIELTNTSAIPYAFADTDVLTYSSYNNPIQNASNESILKGITIGANETIVFVNPAVSEDLKSAITTNGARSFVSGTYDQVKNGAMNFNGDDHVALRSGDTIIDIIGKDTPKASPWGADQTLRRRYAEGNTEFPAQDAKYVPTNWEEALRTVDGNETSKDNFTDLGIPTLGDYVPPPPKPAVEELTMIPADKGLFKNTLKRLLDQEVTVPADLNPTEDGTQGLYVTRTYGFNFNGYRNNLTAAYDRPNYQANQEHVAGSKEAAAYNEKNKDHTLLIESSSKGTADNIPYYPDFKANKAENHIRIMDRIVGMKGIISASGDDYTLTVTEDVTSDTFIHDAPRTKKPGLNTTTTEGEFAITIATQNVLNLFNSPYGGPQNASNDNRGAHTDLEYERQKAKLVEAIYGLDADIVGLMEIENNGFSDTGAIAEFVEAINEKYYKVRATQSGEAESEVNKYAFLGFDKNGDTILDELDAIGSDVITSGIIYRPLKVSIESSKIIPMPSQHAPTIVNDNNVVVKDKYGIMLESGDNYQRDTVAATFVINQTGKRLTLAVNHLKSKGSTCYEDWIGVKFGDNEIWSDRAPDTDLQGQCENFRVAAAYQIGEELEKIGGDRVVIGDMNSYAKEDPMLVLTSNPTKKVIKTARDTFIGRAPQFNESGEPVTITKSYNYLSAVEEKKTGPVWSYSYNDEIGSLDHLLISDTLKDRLIDAKDWHINAAESAFYDYNIYRVDNKRGLIFAKDDQDTADSYYVADAYRSSDHDSAIMSLSYKYGETENGKRVRLVTKSGLMSVPYNIPAKVGAKKGDVASITLTPQGSDYVDSSKIRLPLVELTKDGQALINIEVYGAGASLYSATMELKRNGKTVPGSSVSLALDVTKADSLTPKIIIPEYDETGGSFGLFSIMSLLGLGFLRRRKA